MSKTITATIRIMDKSYEVSCSPEEQDELIASAAIVDERMRAIHDSGKVVGLERMAVMAALNIAHDYVKSAAAAAEKTTALSERIAATIDEAKSLPT